MNGRAARARLGLSVPVVALLAGCSLSGPGPTTPVPSRVPSVAPISDTASPTAPLSSATMVPSQVVRVVASAAAPTASGTVVTNDSTPRGPVTVSVAAASANGGAAVTGATMLPGLAAGETEAAMVKLVVPGDDVIAAVTASAAAAPVATVALDPMIVSGAAFTPDPIQPGVTVTLSSARPVAAAVVLAACYTGSTLVGGGVAVTVAVTPGPRVLPLAAALTQTPTRCLGFAYPA